MRKIVTAMLLAILSVSAFAQQWVDVGIKGGYGSTWLFNSNIFNDRAYVHDFSFGHNYGLKLGYNLNSELEITADLIFSTANQKFSVISETYKLNQSENFKWNQNITTKTMDIPLLFRRNADGGYFEVGPQYSIVKSVFESLEPKSGDLAGKSRDVSRSFQSNYLAGVIGFGSYFIGTENTALTVGLRVSYGFMDLVQKGSEDFSFPSSTSDIDSPYYYQSYEGYKPTNPFAVMFVFELNHDLGYMARASCKKRSKLILFSL